MASRTLLYSSLTMRSVLPIMAAITSLLTRRSRQYYEKVLRASLKMRSGKLNFSSAAISLR